jgi:SAM-dependent methyltransferase
VADYALELSEEEVARYLAMASRARQEEAPAWAAAGIVPGAQVADVGCGPGATLLAMADVVGPTGTVVGVDADPDAVATAQRLIESNGLEHATAVLGSADDTGLPQDGFDVVVLRHVLAHNGGREQAIVRHLAGLVRPQGCVYLVDVEMTAMRMLGAPPALLELADRYVDFHRQRGNDPHIGLRLGELLRGAGLTVLDHSGTFGVMSLPPGLRPPSWAARDAMVAEGVASPDDVARWGRALEQLDAQEERPTMFLPQFRATGRRSG